MSILNGKYFERIFKKPCKKCKGKMKFVCKNKMDYAECEKCGYKILLAIH